jgi:hypothetical protein
LPQQQSAATAATATSGMRRHRAVRLVIGNASASR